MITSTHETEAAGPRRPEIPPAGESISVETRFGTITFGPDDVLDLPNGLVGMPEYHRFGFAPIPDPRMGQFLLLQSLEDLKLAFLVLPIAIGEATIARIDADDACATLAVPPEDARFFVIVTLRKGDKGLVVSINLRAPLIVDSKTRIARQFVLSNPNYPVRKVL
jgi:flagellar assembly factor FliW